MKHIAFFCIPAHGHVNPMLPVATELVRRGHAVRFYSFHAFEKKIRATGASFVSCDAYLPNLSARQESALRRVSTTEMTLQDIRITLDMKDFLDAEFAAFHPDVVYTDSVCFWGKLSALRHGVPMVVSTSTFAFNQLSAQAMKSSPREIAGLMLGLPRVSRALGALRANGYPVKSLFSLVQSDNDTDSVVYTSRRFQPYASSFSAHYLFAGPSIRTQIKPDKARRPLVYVSMGTVINDRPDFYSACIEALRGEDVDLIISCGPSVDIESLGKLPENVQVFAHVDQLSVLSKASAFITHCGMNSVSESLYMQTPMLLYPQTNEQTAVAGRVARLGAGLPLKSATADGIRAGVRKLLQTPSHAQAAQRCAADFRACPGVAGAADFIETAPHTASGVDIMKELTKANVRVQATYHIATMLLAVILFPFVGFLVLWVYIALTVVLGAILKRRVQSANYARLLRRHGLSDEA